MNKREFVGTLYGVDLYTDPSIPDGFIRVESKKFTDSSFFSTPEEMHKAGLDLVYEAKRRGVWHCDLGLNKRSFKKYKKSWDKQR